MYIISCQIYIECRKVTCTGNRIPLWMSSIGQSEQSKIYSIDFPIDKITI